MIEIIPLYAQNSPVIELAASDVGGAVAARAAAQEAIDASAVATQQAGVAIAAAQAAADDSMQTGLDRQATAADRMQTGLDAAATAADRVQTGLDRQAASDSAAAAEQAASNSLDFGQRLQISAMTLPAGSAASATYDQDGLSLQFGLPTGETGQTGPMGPQGPKGDTGAVGPAGQDLKDKSRRSAWSAPYSYCSTAPAGSLETEPVWTIKRHAIASDGSVTTLTATGVAWINYATATYS